MQKKEVRPFLHVDSHERLAIMADHQGQNLAEFASSLLEKAIAYEWHAFSLAIRRSERLGKRWKAVEGEK